MDDKIIHDHDPFKDYKEIGTLTFKFKHKTDEEAYPYSWSASNDLGAIPAEIVINALVEMTDRIINFITPKKEKNEQNSLQLEKSTTSGKRARKRPVDNNPGSDNVSKGTLHKVRKGTSTGSQDKTTPVFRRGVSRLKQARPLGNRTAQKAGETGRRANATKAPTIRGAKKTQGSKRSTRRD